MTAACFIRRTSRSRSEEVDAPQPTHITWWPSWSITRGSFWTDPHPLFCVFRNSNNFAFGPKGSIQRCLSLNPPVTCFDIEGGEIPRADCTQLDATLRSEIRVPSRERLHRRARERRSGRCPRHVGPCAPQQLLACIRIEEVDTAAFIIEPSLGEAVTSGPVASAEQGSERANADRWSCSQVASDHEVSVESTCGEAEDNRGRDPGASIRKRPEPLNRRTQFCGWCLKLELVCGQRWTPKASKL